jgi:Na+/H+ antiporter NhaD/arsenite permease-like protein
MRRDMSAVLALGVFSVAFLFIAVEKFNRVAVVLVGAGLMAGFGLISGRVAFFSEHSGIDWNVIFLLFGMMIMVNIISQTGVFEYLGIWAAKRSRGKPYRLMVMLMLITAVASPFLDNVTTVMLVAPITLVVCRRLDIAPAPYLIAEVLASNIGGAATLIGDPPNIIIGSRANLTFVDFVVHMSPIVVLLFVLFVAGARLMFRSSFEYKPERVAAVLELDEDEHLTDRRMLLRCLAVLAVVIVAFTLHSVIDTEPAVIALLGAGLMVLVTRAGADRFLAEVEWSTLVFFMGLFVMVGALIETGVIQTVADRVVDVFGGHRLGSASVLLWGSAVFGAFFDNIPYTATMAPVVGEMVNVMPAGESGEPLWWAFALGACLGGNGTAVAASANVVVLGIAERNGHPITFWQFTKYGLITTFATTLVAWVYIWLRYFG